MSNVVISRSTLEALERVMAFFGIDSYDRDLFGIAARSCGVDAFSKTIEALDMAIRSDSRSGINRRIRERIEMERELKRRENQGKSK